MGIRGEVEFGGGEIVFRALELSIGSNWCRQNLVQEPLSAIYSNEAFIWSTIFHQVEFFHSTFHFQILVAVLRVFPKDSNDRN